MARRKKQHETGGRAIKLVQYNVPDSWVDQEQQKDYGIDLKFEVFREERTTGWEFGVQVRGTESLKTTKDGKFVICKIEVEALIDHFEKRRYPVYLFRVDNSSGDIYWEFLQRFASNPRLKDWRTQSEVTVRIPIKQKLSDFVQFERELQDHIAVVKDLHPGSIRAAIAKEVAELERLDRRLCIDVSYKNGEILRSVRALENVQLSISVEGSDAKSLIECWKKGISITLQAAQISGSPYFEQMGSVRMSIMPEPDKTFALTLIGMSDEKPFTSIDLPNVEVRRGAEEFSVETCPSHPVSFRGCFSVSSVMPVKINAAFHVDLNRWTGHRLLDLPHFDVAEKFLTDLTGCSAIKSMLRKGADCIPSFATLLPAGIGHLASIVECISLARTLALHYGINPLFSLDFDLDDIRWLHWLTFDRSPTKTNRFVIREKPWGVMGIMKRHMFTKVDSPGRSRQSFEAVCFDVFGEIIQIDRLSLEYTATEAREVSNVRSSDPPVHDDELIFEVICTSATTVAAMFE